ncbi:hypothetical protein BC830DRAFT_1104803 [Chytriomyces sp. MP71]|nr:hypothetical protein BC830DRAFT_1104803 [Chytriomyces sp. MP71]
MSPNSVPAAEAEYVAPPAVSERRASSVSKLFKRLSTPIGPTQEKRLTNSDILKIIDKVKTNDPSLIDIDLRDCRILTASHSIVLAEALAHNTVVKTLNLKNTRMNSQFAVKLGEALQKNTSLLELNLERNAIGPAGIKAIALALGENSTLAVVKLANQDLSAGADAEQNLAKALDKNTRIVKFTLTIRDSGSRGVIDRAIARNNEILRKQRLVQG